MFASPHITDGCIAVAPAAAADIPVELTDFFDFNEAVAVGGGAAADVAGFAPV